MSFDKFRKELIKMHEEDNYKHALQWFLNDIFESAKNNLINDKEKGIDFALQQMIGFKIGKWDDITHLVISSGLSKEEWEHIKEKESSGSLDEEDIEEIDNYFKDEWRGN
jgi:hypothetical protein